MSASGKGEGGRGGGGRGGGRGGGYHPSSGDAPRGGGRGGGGRGQGGRNAGRKPYQPRSAHHDNESKPAPAAATNGPPPAAASSQPQAAPAAKPAGMSWANIASAPSPTPPPPATPPQPPPAEAAPAPAAPAAQAVPAVPAPPPATPPQPSAPPAAAAAAAAPLTFGSFTPEAPVVPQPAPPVPPAVRLAPPGPMRTSSAPPAEFNKALGEPKAPFIPQKRYEGGSGSSGGAVPKPSGPPPAMQGPGGMPPGPPMGGSHPPPPGAIAPPPPSGMGPPPPGVPLHSGVPIPAGSGPVPIPLGTAQAPLSAPHSASPGHSSGMMGMPGGGMMPGGMMHPGGMPGPAAMYGQMYNPAMYGPGGGGGYQPPSGYGMQHHGGGPGGPGGPSSAALGGMPSNLQQGVGGQPPVRPGPPAVAPRKRMAITITDPETGKAIDLSHQKDGTAPPPATKESANLKKADEAAAKKAAEDAKKKEEAEQAQRKAAEEEAQQKAEKEATRKAAEEEEAKRKAAEEEAKRKAAEEEASRKAAADAEARRAAESEAAARVAAAQQAAAQQAETKLKAEAAAAARAAVAVAAVSSAREREAPEPKPEAPTSPVQTGPGKKAVKKDKYDNAESRLAASADVFSVPKPAPPAPVEKPALSVEPALTKVESNVSDNDWENAADGLPTPSGNLPAAAVAAGSDENSRKYTRDFLMTLRDAHTHMPPGLENGEYLSDQYDGGLSRTSSRGSMGRAPSGNIGGPDEWMRGPKGGPGIPPMGGPPGSMGPGGPMGRQGMMGRTGSWNQMGDPRMGDPRMGPMPARGGPGRGPPGPPGAMQGSMEDRWGHRPLPPGPPPGMDGRRDGGGRGGYGRNGPPMPPHIMSGPVPELHKTDNAYKIGITLSEDPEEEKRQKIYKSMLNKLTPDNFERIAGKILEVEVLEPQTMMNLINQIFDKALTETTFCELYSGLCKFIEDKLPKFPGPKSNREITFRRVLLNKCQEEFESGAAAMMAVAKQVEKDEADNKKKEGETEEKEDAKKEEKEEGEITMSEEMKRKVEEQKIYLANLAARKRMLGNIQFIGHLYQKKMLTERIMHECILKLLQGQGASATPPPEDVECLCKLMSTVGREIDNPKSKPHMEIYFKRIEALSQHKVLESRLRFALQDLVDLRKNGWMERRKVEGPKKIQDVHRDARLEQAMQSERGRGGGGGGRGGRGRHGDRRSDGLDAYGGPPRGGYGGPPGPPQPRPMRTMDDRVDGPIRSMRANIAHDVLGGSAGGGFRPGGGGGGGGGAAAGSRQPDPPSPTSMSFRPQAGPGSRPGPPMGAFRDGPPRGPPAPPARDAPRGGDKPHGGSEGSAAPAATAAMPEDKVRTKAKALAEEYYTARDMKEALQCMADLKEGSADFALVVEVWVDDALQTKGRDWGDLVKLVLEMAGNDKSHLTQPSIEAGLRRVLNVLTDLSIDVPKAPKQVADLAAQLIIGGHLTMPAFVGHLLKAGDGEEGEGEDPALLDGGLPLPIVSDVLNAIKAAKGASAAAEAWTAAGVEVEKLLPSFEREDAKAVAAAKAKLSFLQPLQPLQARLEEDMKARKPGDEVLAWMEAEVDADVAGSSEFAAMLSEGVIKGLIPDAGALPSMDDPIPGLKDEYAKLLIRFASKSATAQLACIHAAQKVFHEYGHPKGLMKRLLEDLYYADVLEETAFAKWQDERDDSQAKQKAIIDTSTWLNYLASQEAEQDED